MDDLRAMIAPAESPESAPRPSWLDRWFEPPWRAFLSWMVLAAAMGWVLDHGGSRLIRSMVGFLFTQLNPMLPAPLPPMVQGFAMSSNAMLLLFWFEPFALRLNLLRGLAWLSLRCSAFAAFVWFALWPHALSGSLGLAASSVLSGAVLHGCRTRPWMSVPGGVLMAATFYSFEPSAYPPALWQWIPAMTFPYAAALIFGTRLIPRAGRETPGGGRLRW